MEDAEVHALAEAGDTEAVAAYLAGGVSAEDAARVMISAVNGGRVKVVQQLLNWSVERWGEPLLGWAALRDLVDAAVYFKGGEDPDLDRRLSKLRDMLERRSSSPAERVVSFALAGETAQDEKETESDDELGLPARGLAFLHPRSDEPVGRPEDGVAYFTRRMFSTFPQWSVLAFRSPASDLAPRLVDALGVDLWIQGAADQPIPEAEDEYFLLQLKGHDWSLLLTLSLPQVPRLLGQEAQELSAKLGLRVAAFGYEETGGSSIAQVFEAGRPVEKARGRGSWNKLFRDEGLFIPFFGLHSEGGQTELVIEGLERTRVDSLHFFA